MNPNNTESTETATPVGMSKAAVRTDTAAPEASGRVRRRLRLGAGWRFARHLLEMVLAMLAGMAVLGVALGVLGEPPGYANPLVEYGLMGASMAAPMVAWMRHRGHSWSDGLEMTLAMLAPMFALVVPVELGVAVPGLSEGSLMMLSHVAMIGGMVVLMIYRFERYAHGVHGNRAQSEERSLQRGRVGDGETETKGDRKGEAGA